MNAADYSLKIDDTLAGTYRIVSLVGKGGMGEVYEVAHARLAGRYAVKLLLQEIGTNEDILKRFKQEAEVTSRLRHPNIVHVIDFDRTPDGTPYLVMEFLEGRDLAEELRVVGALPLARVVDIVDQVASGLAAAHAENVVHRDLKPANLFLTPLRGRSRELVKIVDFGISKVRALVTGGLTRTQTIIGTPQYMAPEQARGLTREIDGRTDQFSLGTITYEMLAGTPPFRADEVSAILYQIVHEAPAPLQSLGIMGLAPVEEVIQRAMSKDPAARYPSISEFAEALVDASSRCDTRAPGFSAPGPFKNAGLNPGLILPVPTPSPPAVSVTTFRASTGQVSAGQDMDDVLSLRPSRKGLWVVTAALGAALTIGGLVWLRSGALDRGSRGHGAANIGVPGAPSTNTAPIEPAEITVDLLELPNGARIKLDGEERKLPLRLARDQRRHQLTISAPGYLPREHWITASRDLTVQLALEKEPHPAETATVQGAAPPPLSGAAVTAPPHHSHSGRPKKSSHNLVTDL
jgi:serine/threonine protein kinase